MNKVQIVGKDGQSVRVTEFGQLTVSPVEYSTPVTDTLDAINTAFNFIGPSSGQQIVITDIILTANKNVGASDATVDIYEANSATATTISNSILQLEMIKQSSLPLIGLNMIVPAGKWVNAKTNDNDVFVTIMYYRVPVED